MENITFNLVNNIDVAESEQRLESYREQNVKSITRNATIASDEDAIRHAQQAAQKEQARLSREIARREEEDVRMDREEDKKHIIDTLAQSQGNAVQIVREGERVMLKRTSTQRADVHRQQQGFADPLGLKGTVPNSAFVIRGLRKQSQQEVEQPYDSFGGLRYELKYHVLQDHYEWDWLNNARSDAQYTSGGYDVQEYCERALSDAFSGLGVFIGDKIGERDAPAFQVATIAAAIARVKPVSKVEDMDAVF